MADSKTESIKVNVKKKAAEAPQRESREGGYLGADADAPQTDADAAKEQAATASHQGRVIQPTKAAENDAKPDNEAAKDTDAQQATGEANAEPTPTTTTPGESLDDTSDDTTATDTITEPTVDAHATQQREALGDNRDYKISKKQLKKAPQTSSKHAHKTWVFLALVTLVSLGLAYGYLTVVEGMSLSEITTKLGL